MVVLSSLCSLAVCCCTHNCDNHFLFQYLLHIYEFVPLYKLFSCHANLIEKKETCFFFLIESCKVASFLLSYVSS